MRRKQLIQPVTDGCLELLKYLRSRRGPFSTYLSCWAQEVPSKTSFKTSWFKYQIRDQLLCPNVFHCEVS